ADLLRQVLEERAPAIQLIAHADDLMDRPPAEVLPMFANSLVRTLDNWGAFAAFKIFLSESARKPAIAEMFNKLGPMRGFSFLTREIFVQADARTLTPETMIGTLTDVFLRGMAPD